MGGQQELPLLLRQLLEPQRLLSFLAVWAGAAAARSALPWRPRSGPPPDLGSSLASAPRTAPVSRQGLGLVQDAPEEGQSREGLHVPSPAFSCPREGLQFLEDTAPAVRQGIATGL